MTDPTPKFEDILDLVGCLGRWQLLQLLWALLIGFQSGTQTMSSIFMTSVPSHHCALPGDEEDLEVWLPVDHATGNFSQCRIFKESGSQEVIECSSYVYRMKACSSSVVSEWDLVCEHQWKASFVKASYMFGACLGSLLCGVISDQLGRKRALVLCSVVFIISSFSAVFSSSYSTFIVLRIISAVADTGLFNCFLVLFVEITGTRLRGIMGTICQMPFGIGLILLSGLAFAERRWRRLQLIMSAPSLLMLSFWWLMPESPQWLIAQGRLEEALAVLKNAAALNNRQLPSDEHLLNLMDQLRLSEAAGVDKKETTLLARFRHGASCVINLVRTPKMRRHCLASLYIWMACSMLFHGVSFDIAHSSGSPYLTILLGGIVSIVSLIACGVGTRRLGRRLMTFISILSSGVTILCMLAVPKDLTWPKLLLGNVGKFASGVTYGILFVYTSELYPTKLRTAGLGAASTFGMLGAMMAPFVVDVLHRVHWTFPSCVFGGAAITAALASLLLPETSGCVLPETVEDVEEGRWTKLDTTANKS